MPCGSIPCSRMGWMLRHLAMVTSTIGSALDCYSSRSQFESGVASVEKLLWALGGIAAGALITYLTFVWYLSRNLWR